ncbi:hypothetical protein OPW19_18940 [Vibrio europaeus]|uniref:hypothetical protein n=1 Tax=Vibrio europaeus TaxID=300876 RepID=UPI00233F1B62|nr:hypothetical protein [Vibrio europaeus]MDC5821890.1 hypothetical protein [Vibrio europaeus]
MLTEDDYYSRDQDTDYIVPSFSVSSFNAGLLEKHKLLVAEQSKDTMTEYVWERMEFENSMVRKMQDWACHANIQQLSESLQIPNDPHSFDVFDWLDFLIEVAQKSQKLLKYDALAMDILAKEDPGVYAQTLICRRFVCRQQDSLRHLTDNKLARRLSPKNPLNPANHDMKEWYIYAEKHGSRGISERISPYSD